MSNRVVEIVKAALPSALEAGDADAFIGEETFGNSERAERTVDGSFDLDAVALAVIAALEKEGAKIMWREPTEEMANELYGVGVIHCWKNAWDAAPRYGEPTEFQEDTRHYTEDERRSLGRLLTDGLKSEPSG
jgi:hypothetical protein